jgi:hypothetical protein
MSSHCRQSHRVNVASFCSAMAAKHHGIARLQLKTKLVIRDTCKQAGRKASSLKSLAVMSAYQTWARHARAGNDHFSCGWIEQRILNAGAAGWYAREMQTLIQRETADGTLPSFVDAAQCADNQRSIKGRG